MGGVKCEIFLKKFICDGKAVGGVDYIIDAGDNL